MKNNIMTQKQIREWVLRFDEMVIEEDDYDPDNDIDPEDEVVQTEMVYDVEVWDTEVWDK